MYAFSRYKWIQTGSRTYIHKSMYSYIDIHKYPDIRTHVNIGSQIYLYICVHVSSHIDMHIFIHTHTYIHIYEEVYAYAYRCTHVSTKADTSR